MVTRLPYYNYCKRYCKYVNSVTQKHDATIQNNISHFNTIVGWVYSVFLCAYHQWKSLCYIIYKKKFFTFLPLLKTKWGVCIVILIKMPLIQLFRERNYAKAFLTCFWRVKSREYFCCFGRNEWMNEAILKRKYTYFGMHNNRIRVNAFRSVFALTDMMKRKSKRKVSVTRVRDKLKWACHFYPFPFNALWK